MPFYPRLKKTRIDSSIKIRASKNLLRPKAQIQEEIPEKDLDKHMLLATWNIRDLGKRGPKQGKRKLEDLFYIAEIISSFDLVAVQEVNDLDDWENVMDILGRDWDYIATDVSNWKDGGNGERMTFVYDKRKVWFKNIAGEIILGRANLISKNILNDNGKVITSGRQFARTPFMVSFQSAWFKFDLCTVHIYYGNESEDSDMMERRREEIEVIAKEISKRAKLSLKEKHSMILLGDFNIKHPEHKTMKALTKYNFLIPTPLSQPTNLKKDKYYDQIALKTTDKNLLPFLNDTTGLKDNAGVFDLFKTVIHEDQWSEYVDDMKQTTEGKKKVTDEDFKKYFNLWKTFHLSDHKPMWVRIPIDKSEEYISSIQD